PADGVGLHHVKQELPALRDGDVQRPRELGVVRGAAGLYQAAHDTCEQLVQQPGVGHGRAAAQAECSMKTPIAMLTTPTTICSALAARSAPPASSANGRPIRPLSTSMPAVEPIPNTSR